MQILGTQRALVDQFIASAIRTTHNSRETARTLFELLLPNELKAQAPDQENMMLILDEEAARYPWELLEDRWSGSGQPFVIEHGLLRQLESSRPRELGTSISQKRTALVIGDPVSRYPELKGAQEEAQMVTRALQQAGRFTARQLVRPTTQQVVNGLFEESYQILHLAGHGVYQMPAKGAMQCSSCGQKLPDDEIAERRKLLKPLTGMIIGDEVVLSPQEVHQMRHVPELVFINCCHLGLIEGDKSSAGEAVQLKIDFNRIAANVAAEFIQMGVRAVIAAGWAVDDGAAQTFAVTFYDQMMNGKSFGDSVREARRATYFRHRETNTWGAYQCYGDPDYRLVQDSQETGGTSDRKLLSHSDAAAQLDNITAGLTTMAGVDIATEVEKIHKIEEQIAQHEWDRDGRLCAALARAYGEARQFKEAVQFYENAIAADDAQVRLKDIEQLANLESRWAIDEWKGGEKIEAVMKKINRSIDRLDSLMKGLETSAPEKDKAAGRTAERLSLLGGAYKRKALISEKERLKSLKEMGRWYKAAFELKKSGEKSDCYHLLNWIAAELVASWQDQHVGQSLTKQKKEFRGYLVQARQELEAALEKQKKFWTEVMLIDTELLQVLLENSLDDKRLERISGKYLEAKRRGSPRELESVIDHLDFLLEMAQPQDAIAASLGRLVRKLTEGQGRQQNQTPTGKC